MTLPPGRLTAEELALGRRIRAGVGPLFSSPTPTAIGLPDSRILLVNDSFATLMGYDRSALLGVPVISLLTPKMRPGAEALRTAVLADAGGAAGGVEKAFHHTVAFTTSDGREIDVRTSTIVLRSRTGTPTAVLARFMPVTSSDVPPALWTGRLGQADAATLAAALVEHPTLDDLSEPTSVTSRGGVILRVNRAFSEAFGWENRDVVGLLGADLLPPELGSWAAERLEAITGAPLVPEPSNPRIRHRDGSTVAVRATSVPVRDESGETRYIITAVLPADTSN